MPCTASPAQAMRQHLPPGAAVDALLGHLAVPALEVLVQLRDALEAAAFERVVVDVAATAFPECLALAGGAGWRAEG